MAGNSQCGHDGISSALTVSQRWHLHFEGSQPLSQLPKNGRCGNQAFDLGQYIDPELIRINAYFCSAWQTFRWASCGRSASRCNQQECIMGQRIDQFCEDLRIKLTGIDSGLANLKTKIEAKNQQADEAVRVRLEGVRSHIDQDRAKVLTARGEMAAWMEARKAATKEAIADLKARREFSKLQHRADKAEEYAAAALVVALSAVDEAEQAALEAWLARADADFAQAPKAASVVN